MDVCFLKNVGKGVRRKLDALVAIENGRFADSQSSMQRIKTEAALECIRQSPSENVATEPVANCHQIHEATTHADVRDIDAPDLIRLCDAQIAQEIRIDVLHPLGWLWAWDR